MKTLCAAVGRCHRTIVATAWNGPEVDDDASDVAPGATYRDKRLTIRIDKVLKGALPQDGIIVVVPEMVFLAGTGPVPYLEPGGFKIWCDNANLAEVKNVLVWPKYYSSPSN